MSGPHAACLLLRAPVPLAVPALQREGEAWVGWVKASDLVFCAERSCGTAVELGAACGGTTACCNLTADGGQAGAACLTQARSTPYGYGASNAACSVPKLQYTAGERSWPVPEFECFYRMTQA